MEGARTLKMFGTHVPVRPEVVDILGLSAHADADEIPRWLRAAPNTTYLVHGEPEGAQALRDRLDAGLGRTAVVPRPGERVSMR